MASKYRNLFDADLQASLAKIPVAAEAPSTVDVARAQTLARSSGNPAAQRLGMKMLQVDEDQRAKAAYKAEAESRKAARLAEIEAEKAQKEQEAAAEAERARNVRAGAAAGLATTTDIETGKRSLDTNADGTPKYKVGKVGDVIEKPTINQNLATVPGLGDVVSSGALGKPAEYTGIEVSQNYRNERGEVVNRPLPTTTDPKTGVITAMSRKDEYGAPVKQELGVDPVVVDRTNKLARIEEERAAVDLRKNAVDQTRLRFEAQWEPVKKEFDAAVKELNDFPKTFRRNESNGKWVKPGDPVKGNPAELDYWQRQKQELQTRYDAAKAKHDKLAPTAENLNRVDTDVKKKRLELAAAKMRIEHNLPDDDGGLGEILAREAGLVDDVPAADVKAEILDAPAPGPVAPTAAQSPAAAAPPAEVKPLVPADDPIKAERFAQAFQGLRNPEQFTVGTTGEGWQMIQRNGANVGRVDSSDGAPVVVLNAGENADLRGIAALGGTKGIPVYLSDGTRMNLGKEAAWASQAFAFADPAKVDVLDPLGSINNTAFQLQEMGADLPSIIEKVKKGEISMQVGEAMAKGLYGETLQASDPLAPDTVKTFLEENADLKQKWDASDKGTAAHNEMTGAFVSDWYSKNQHKPGVTWGMMQAARKQFAKDKTAWETTKGVGDVLAEAGGSMVGLLAAYPTVLGMTAYAEIKQDTTIDAATSDMVSQRGRANKNFIRGIETNRKKWFTDDGKKRLQGLNAAMGELRAYNTTRDVYPEGVRDPKWKEGMKSRIEALTDAAFNLHAMNLEDGWEMTRDDVDPNKNRVLMATLGDYLETGDPAQWDNFTRRLLLDKGTLQSEQYTQDLTQGRGKFASAVIGGAVASDFESVVEILSTVLTVGATKAITVGGRVLKGAEGAVTLSRGARVARFGEQVAQDFHKLGMLEDTLAKPASLLGKSRNIVVKGTKAGAVNAASEGTEEIASGLGDPTATVGSLVDQFAVGALAGMVLAPVMVAPTMAATASRENFKRNKQADTLVEAYNKAGRNTEGFQPISREQAVAAIQIANNPARAAASERLEAAKVELQLAQSELAGTQAGLKTVRDEGQNLTAAVPGDQNADTAARAESLQAWQAANAEQERGAQGKVESAVSRFSRALADYGKASGELSDILATALDITSSTRGMKPAEAAKVNGLAKVAFGRADLLTGSERSSIAGLKTQDGMPYFESTAGGAEILTDAGRAEVQAQYPTLGGKIATPESMALFEAAAANSPTTTNEQDPQGTPGQQAPPQNPQPAPANPNAPGGTVPDGSGQPAAGTANGTGSAPAQAPAVSEAGIYEAARQQDPALPEIPAVVTQAFAGGQPVSVSMQKASGIDVPEGYTRQGNVWNPPAQPASKKAPSVAPALAQAAQVAESVKARVLKAIPSLKGRLSIVEDDLGGGGADVAIETGEIRLSLPSIQRAITKANGNTAAVSEYLENIVARHEAVHVVQVEALRAQWEDANRPGEFIDYFRKFYADLAPEILSPEALKAARRIYGKDKKTGEWHFDKITDPGQQAAEFVRMLVEAKLDGNTDQFSELFRAVKTQGAKSKLAKLIRKAIEILTSMKLSPAAEAHVAKLKELYADLTAQVQESAPKPQQKAESAEKPAIPAVPGAIYSKGTTVRSDIYKGEGDIILTSEARQGPNGTEYEAYFSGTARVGTIQEKHITSTVKAPAITDADASNPLRLTGLAIKAALDKFPRLSGKLRQELEDAADEVTDALEALPAGDRAQAAETAIADRINLIADREAERTGKKREEVIEGFRAVAGKRAAKQAASIEQAVIGSESPTLPAGKQERRDTPNSEMTVDVTSTFVDLDQLVGSSDPLFPGGALQPRNRSTQASQNQREEMVQNIRDKDDQHRRYLEGSTTDSGRMVVAPLFGADGKQMTFENGDPMFYVISGNGRRNALQEAATRKVAAKITAGFRESAAVEGIDVEGMKMPVPVSIFVPKTAKEAIDLAEYSNRDAQLSVSNTEQANRDASSIEKANILKLWEPDATGDAAAASNRGFVKAFARAVGDEGIIDNRGELTDEGAKRIERAMVAMLLGPEQAPLLDLLFNRSGALGLRAILGGVASESGSLLKLAGAKPDFDLSPVLADALRVAVEAKQALANGEIRDVGEFFDQGNLFESTEMTPERQLARAIVESRSRKAIRDILGAYRRGAEAVDTGTMSMFAEAETSREDLILKALEARPIEQVIAEVEAEFGAKVDLAAKLRVGAPAIKKLDPGQRREFVAAVNAEVERLRGGIVSAEEWQRLNPDALSAKAGLFQRFLDSHTPETIQSGFNRLLSKPVQAVLGSSPATMRDYLDAAKAVFYEKTSPVDMTRVPQVSASPAALGAEIKKLLDVTFNGIGSNRRPATLGSSPVAEAPPSDFQMFPKESGTLGIPRKNMPQIKMRNREAFMSFLDEKGISHRSEKVAPSSIKPVQAEFSPFLANRAKGIDFHRALFISSDNYLIDGHHQWLAQAGRPTVDVVRIDAPARKALSLMFAFPLVEKSAGMATLGSSPAENLSKAEAEFDEVLAKYKRETPPQETEQQLFDRLRAEFGNEKVEATIAKYEDRLAKMAPFKTSFDETLREISRNHGAQPLFAPLKGRKRGVEKALIDYGGRVSRMGDIVRGSIIAETIYDVDAIAREIHRRWDGKIKKFENRFTPPLPSGYSDMIFHVEIADGVVAELQVHIPEMLRAKEEAGHPLYEEYRSIKKDPAKKERATELSEQMLEVYSAAAKLAIARANASSKASGESSLSYANFIAVFSDTGEGVPSNSPTAGPLGGSAIGTSSTSKNLVPGGKSEAFIASPDTESGGSNQDISGASLKSSPAAELDLFGPIEAAIAGPRAQAKRNAVDLMRKAPPAARENIAKAVAKREGLADLDLFAAAAVSNLDAKPRRGESAPDGSAPRQSGDPLNPRLYGGQPAAGTRGTGTVGTDQDLFDFSGRAGAKPGSQSSQGAASDVQGPGTRDGGSGNGSASTNPDLGGRGSGNEGSGSGQQGGQADSGNAGQRKLTEHERPPVGSPERNFTIGKDTVLAEGGAITRIRNNIAAIDLLRTLEADGRNATPEEKAILAKFVGWGGLPQVFDEENALKVENGEAETRRTTADRYESYGAQYENLRTTYREQADAIDKWNAKWGDYYRQIQKLLTPDEWESARESIINAHYTSPTVISGMWDAVKRLGFRGGNVLEPAGGIGHYFGLMPPSMVKRSRQYGIELDRISGRIMAKLYPEADIEVTAFQETTLPDNSQDLVISNVPFANITVSDAYLDAQDGAPKFNLHNYFFERALRMTRPGGLVAFITTANTMDAQITQRKWLAERADFMGAIRLPNDAFKGNANTAVVTDIIFLRKPDGSPNPMAAEQWTSTRPVALEGGGTIEVNEYFSRHPEMILGRLADDGSMYGGKKEMTVHGTGDLAEQLRAAVERLPENVVGEGQAGAIERLSIDNRAAKDGAFIEEDGKIRIKGSTEPVPTKELGKVRAFMKLRDTLNDLYLMEGDPEASDAAIAAQRKALNSAYDGFKAIYKELHETKNKGLLETDPDFYRTLGLEVPVGQALLRKQEYRKADVFSKRVLEPRVEPTSAESIEDAVIHSFRWKGRMDAGYVGKLLGITRDEAEARLLATEFAYRDPATGKVEHATTYLAGNVRRKLRDAEMAAKKDPSMQRNADALRAALPEDVGWTDINFKMGSAWIPAEMYERFLAEKLFDGRFGKAKIIYNKGVGDLIGDSFIVQQGVTGYAHSVDVQWATPRKSATAIAEALLNQRDPRVNDTIDKKKVYNAAETDKARQAAARMQDAFQEWVASSPDVQESLHRIYNESFNSHVVPKYDGSFMQLPWVASDFDLYPDKKHVVWRALQEGTLLVAHGVGGGKTIIGTAIAMEARRLGLAKKPLIVVHNATLEQFATTISRMAPTARVLVARKADLEGPKRKEFMGRVRSGDWDAVVMAHSTFDLIPDDPEWERKQTDDLVKELEDAIRESDENVDMDGDLKKIKDPSVKELVKMRRRLKERVANLQARRTDDVLTFQELGIDAMIVDEVHRYKKQPFVTRQSNIAGIDTGFSKRGSAMQLRAKWVQAINQGRGVFTMTGTPVTNTLGESWNMVRLVRPDLLKEFGVRTFDRFVSAFGNIKQSGELRPNGQYKPVTRLSEFTNIPEWNRFWGLAADVKMGDDMEVKGRPKIKGGKAMLTAVTRTAQVKSIIDEISKVIDRYDAMTGKEKHENQHIPLLTYNAARMAAIDVRLINPEAKDEDGSKVNTALKNVMRLYTETTENKGTQVIFSDSYRPLRTTKLDLSAAEFERQVSDEDATDEYDDGEGFNLYQDIRKKLIAMDVPPSEIAIIGEMKNDKQKEALFARINSGEVRIIMGSTETLGTGVNMQERMIAAHHLDVPWTPAGLEQRDGRVYRQGNMWAELGREIEIMRYGMKDTLDAALWQKLETKERMIKQAVSGKVNARTIEDDAGLLNYMEQKAALSGADGMLKFTLDEEVRNLKNEWRAHRNRQFDIQRQSGYSRDAIERADKELPNARRVAKVVAPLVEADPSEVEWTFEDGEPMKGEDARKDLDVIFKERRKKAGAIMNPEKAKSVREPIHATANGVPMLIEWGGISEDLGNAANPDLRWQLFWFPRFETETLKMIPNSSPHPGSVINQTPTRAQSLSLVPDSLERDKAQAEKDLALYADEQSKPFTKSDNFRKSLIDQATLYKRMGLAFPESSDVYAAGIGEDWQAVLDKETAPKAETSPRSETPASYPGKGLAPAMQSLGSSPAEDFSPRFRPMVESALRESGIPFDEKAHTVDMLHVTRQSSAKSINQSGKILGTSFFTHDPAVARKFGQRMTGPKAVMKVKLDTGAIAPTGGYFTQRTPELVRGADGVFRAVEQTSLGSSPAPESSSARDSDYLAAVESGDMETAQRMVDEAAKGAGYDVRPIYRGRQRFTEVIKSAAAYFAFSRSSAQAYAEEYGGEDGVVLKAYAKFNNTASEKQVADVAKRIGHEFTDESVPAAYLDVSPKLLDALKEAGFDSVSGTDSLPDDQGSISVIAALFPAKQIKSADPVTYDASGNLIPLSQRFNPASDSILRSSPSPESSAVQVALAKMPPIYRQVFEAIEGGASVTEVTGKFNVTPRAVENILNSVRSRIATAQAAAGPAGLSPVMQGEQIKGGRPDLALGGIPQVAAVDQIRNESGIPDVRGWEEVFQQARDMLVADYQGTYDMLLDKARNLQPMSDVEVAAAKSIISRETLAGKIHTPEERMKLGMLIHGYRDIGTETARSLAIRRDPHMSPAERHAQFIAEALFTPDPATRARMRKKNASIEEIMSGWMRRVDTIKAELLAQGIDIEAALAEFNEAQEARKQAAAESPQTQTVIDEQIRKLNRREKAVIEAIRSGALVSKAAFVTGLSTDEVKAIYGRFLTDIRTAMAESAKRYLAGSLASSPADMMGGILADLGLPDLGAIDDTVADFVDRRGEKPRAPRKPRKAKPAAPAAPEVPGLTPEQQDALDEDWQRFLDSPLSSWKAFQEEAAGAFWTQEQMDEFDAKAEAVKKDWSRMKDLLEEREGINETTGEWTETRPFTGQGQLLRDPVNETTGTFDIHDPVAVKRVMDAFAVARGGKMDALMEFWKMSILTGPQTAIVNTSSNLINGAYNLLPRRLAEASVNSMLGVLGLGSDKAATFGEIAPMLRELHRAIQIGARMAVNSWKIEGRTFEAYAMAKPLQMDFSGLGAEYVPPALGGKFGKLMRSLSFRHMTAADEFLKSVYSQMEVAAQAYRIAAREEKLKGAVYDARITELMQPGSVAWVRALDASKKITFQQDLAFSGMSRADAANKARTEPIISVIDALAELGQQLRSMPFAGPAFTFFLPFIQTPANIFKLGLEMSPLGTFLSVADGARALRRKIYAGSLSKEDAAAEAQALYDRARFVRDLTNQTLAWAAFFGLQGLMGGDDEDELPMITGTMPYKSTKKGERDNAYAVMPPMTIRLGDVQFSYARFEPFKTVLATLADVNESARQHGGYVKAGVVSDALVGIKNQIHEMPVLYGISSVFKVFENPERGADRLAANIVTGFVPNLIRQPIREADGTLRDQNPRGEDGFFTAIAKRVGYSIAPQFAPARLDVWGNPIKTNRGDLVGNKVTDTILRVFDPTNATINPTSDPIDRWIFNWNMETGDSSQKIAIQPISSFVEFTVPGEKKQRRVNLTVAEQMEANIEAGQMARSILGDGWENRPRDMETRDRIVSVVQEAQTIQRKKIKMEKIEAGLPPLDE